MPKSLDIIDPKRDLNQEQSQPVAPEENEIVPQRRGGGSFYLIIGIIAIVVAVLAAIFILYRNDKNTSSSVSVTPVASATAEESAATTATATASSTATAQATTSTTAFTYSGQKIRIANGNGINGEAAKVKGVLEAAGFQVASTGNATKTYTESIVYYKTGQENLANALKDAIKGSYTATTQKSDSIVGIYDAVIALGAK